MPPIPPRALPELFLTFLAPSLRPSLPRLSSSQRHLSTLKSAQQEKELRCTCREMSRTRAKGGEKQQKRGMSRLATRRALDESRAEIYIPVASTSAVRLDSPSPSSFPRPKRSMPSIELPETAPPPIMSNDTDSNLGELPHVLKRIKALSLKHPDKSPSEIISMARMKAFSHNERNHSPPTPPPPIVLHPQPYSSNSQFFTPLLLQAIMLGASALGLLTRRKVMAKDGTKLEESKTRMQTAKEEAEERIDEIQALNLLISAYAVPEAIEVPPTAVEGWRNEMLKPLVRLVSQALASDQPLNRLGIASILHFVSPRTQVSDTYQEAQPLLAARALEAYQNLPPNSSPETLVDQFILSSFLSIIYPRQHTLSSSPHSSNFDRSILDTVSQKILSSPTTAPPELLLALGHAAARAKRLDIFDRVVRATEGLSMSLRLDLAVTGLDLVASNKDWRNDREKVVPLADLFASIVTEMEELDKRGVDRLDRGIYLLRTAFAIDRPLEPYITRSILSTLSSCPSLLDNKKFRGILVDVLRHLSRSRNPSLARQILASIPVAQLRLSYLIPLLSSSHASTSQTIWELLLSHPSLSLTESAISARFSSLSHRSANSPTTLETARNDFKLIEERGFVPTVKIWNQFLHVVVRFGGDRAVENVLSAMERVGIEKNEWTRTILLQREMIRRDTQLRTVREGNKAEGGMREGPMIERPVKEMSRVNRRGGGQAQMRKLREAMREYQAQARQGGGNATVCKLDITPNLLLKSFTRWTRECNTDRLLQLTKLVVGIDLTSLSLTPSIPRSTLQLSNEEFDKLRVPAFRTLISAFERRGRVDFAKNLRVKLKEERDRIAETRTRPSREEVV